MEYSDYVTISEFIKNNINIKPEIAVVLGSGLGSFIDEMEIDTVINYNDIKGFPTSTIEGHKGAFVFGYVNDVPVVAMQGRVHFYEGYSIDKVTMPIRILKLLGVKAIVLTNAAGGVNSSFSAGDFMLICDHISAFVPNPLIGTNISEFGPRFPDMTEVYNNNICNAIRKSALKSDIDLKEGVYIQLTGPSYETPAEVRMVKGLGADAVGMSTVCEAIVANHCGMMVGGISLITNLASGISDTPLSHNEVQEAGKIVEEKFKILIKETIINIKKEVL